MAGQESESADKKVVTGKVLAAGQESESADRAKNIWSEIFNQTLSAQSQNDICAATRWGLTLTPGKRLANNCKFKIQCLTQKCDCSLSLFCAALSDI